MGIPAYVILAHSLVSLEIEITSQKGSLINLSKQKVKKKVLSFLWGLRNIKAWDPLSLVRRLS